jgi:excisionase family DNA binding protein
MTAVDDYLTVVEVAELARCHKGTVRSAIHNGTLKGFELAGRLLIRRADARTWIEAKPATPTDSPHRRRSTRHPAKVAVKPSEGW